MSREATSQSQIRTSDQKSRQETQEEKEASIITDAIEFNGSVLARANLAKIARKNDVTVRTVREVLRKKRQQKASRHREHSDGRRSLSR